MRLHLQRTSRKCPKQTLMMQRRNEHHEITKREEALNEEKSRKRKLPEPNPERSNQRKEQEKQRREQDEIERVAATSAQESPYDQLSSKELREVIYEKTGTRTWKQNEHTLQDVLVSINIYENQPRGEYFQN